MSDDELGRLVARAARHDADAWEQLYRRCYRPVFGYARRRVFDERAAEDVVSETMTRALANIARFSPEGGGFDAWVFGIARNVVLEHGRATRRTTGTVDERRPATTDGPEDQVVAADEAELMRRAFARLSDDERELLELKVHAGLSSDEVARLVGKRPGTIRMAQARALQRLRTFVEEVQRDV